MSFKRTNKLDMETILVAGCDSDGLAQAFATGTLVGAGTALGVADGQLGVISWDGDGVAPYGTFLTAITLADARAVKVVRGTPASADITTADPWEVRDQGFLASGVLRAGNVRSITVQKPRPARMSSAALMDLPVPADEAAYRIYNKLESVRNDKYFDGNDEVVHAAFTTPDYTTLGTTNPLDHMLRNLLYDLNKQSKHVRLSNGAFVKGNRNILGLGINIDGSGTGTAIGTLTCGDSVDIMVDVDTVTGATITTSIVVDYPLLLALAYQIAKQAYINTVTAGTIAAPITATSEIQVINLSDAGDPAAGEGVDAALILGLPHTTAAYFDNIEQVMTDVTVNPADQLLADAPVVVKGEPDEGTGQGRKWLIMSDNRAQLQVHTMQNHPHNEFFSEGVKYIDAASNYTSYIVDFYDTEQTLTTRELDPKQLVLLLCSDYTCPTVTAAATSYETNLTPGEADVDVVPTDIIGCCGDDGVETTTLTVDDVLNILTGWIVLHNPNVAINDNVPYETATGLV